MKRTILIIAALLFSLCAQAIPARPGIFTYTQPDGSIVRLEVHGDEFLFWYTLAGTNQVVKLDQDGYWQPSAITPSMRKGAAEKRKKSASRRAGVRPSTHTDNPLTHGTHHIPVILVEFTDVKFTLDQISDRFTRLLNETGYSDNGATGSAAQYYKENSHGTYTPVFDVYGPVTLPHAMAYYGEDQPTAWETEEDCRPEIALYDACKILDASVDFSSYDEDQDGIMDMILFYYAGYSQAEGGPKDAIWPHQYTVQDSDYKEAREAVFDGLKLGQYFCTSELKSFYGSKMCGIGTTVHEFGHALGLPDFYDTDYEDNGYCAGPELFSVMASGSYTNDGNTPPYFNAEERIILGWMTEDDIRPLTNGRISFGSVQNDIAFKSYTSTEGEYFLYECRDGSGWDRYTSAGLLVYHVDKSATRYVGRLHPIDHWLKWKEYNKINAYGDHPCFYVVPSSDQKNLDYKQHPDYWVFPGHNHVTSFVPIDWDGFDNGISITDISYADGKVTLTFSGREEPPLPNSFAKMGIPSIQDPGLGKYHASDVFTLKMDLPDGNVPASTLWRYDGNAVSEESVTLTAGHHSVSATVRWADGSVETFELLLHVQ